VGALTRRYFAARGQEQSAAATRIAPRRNEEDRDDDRPEVSAKTFALHAMHSHACRKNKGHRDMDKDRIKGSAKQIWGRIKQAAGKLTGDRKLEADGRTEKAVGKVQNAYGGAKDKVREA
jgi:uncharacterized protein YjbJ (UPF0337 family)